MLCYPDAWNIAVMIFHGVIDRVLTAMPPRAGLSLCTQYILLHTLESDNGEAISSRFQRHVRLHIINNVVTLLGARTISGVACWF